MPCKSTALRDHHEHDTVFAQRNTLRTNGIGCAAFGEMASHSQVFRVFPHAQRVYQNENINGYGEGGLDR